MDHRLQPAPRARDIGAVNRHLFLVAFDAGVADGAARRGDGLAWFVALLAAVGERGDDLRNDLAGPLDLHPVADAEILFGDEVRVCSVASLTLAPPISTGSSYGVRVEGAGAADIDADIQEAGHGDIGREFPGDGPPGFAAADHAELLLERERVGFNDAAIDREVESGADPVFDLVGPGRDLGERGAPGPVRGHGDAPASQRVQQVPLRAEGEARAFGGSVLPRGSARFGRGIADRDRIPKRIAAGGGR